MTHSFQLTEISCSPHTCWFEAIYYIKWINTQQNYGALSPSRVGVYFAPFNFMFSFLWENRGVSNETKKGTGVKRGIPATKLVTPMFCFGKVGQNHKLCFLVRGAYFFCRLLWIRAAFDFGNPLPKSPLDVWINRAFFTLFLDDYFFVGTLYYMYYNLEHFSLTWHIRHPWFSLTKIAFINQSSFVLRYIVRLYAHSSGKSWQTIE